MSRADGDRISVVFPAMWAGATIVALFFTLLSLRGDDADGLNNALQLPLAAPWMLMPTAVWTTHVQDAWVLAAEGLLNAVLLRRWLTRRAARAG